MTKKVKYAFCSLCNKEVEEASRKPLETMQKVLWIVVIVATLGIASIAYAFYISNRPKVYCSTCFTKLQYSDKPFVKPKKKREDMTPKERILDKTGLKEEEVEEEAVEPPKKKTTSKKRKKEGEEEKIMCVFCGEELDEDYPVCPFCQTNRKV